MEHKVILVPIDGSDNSLAAVRNAVELASSCHAVVEFLHVVNLDGAFIQSAGECQKRCHSVLEDAVDVGRKILNQALDMTPDDVEAKGHCISGDDAAQTILTSAEKIDADMIVVGSRGLGAFRAALLGSVSSYVLSHACCPVIVVKAARQAEK
jgi:nucleotide-binding universal stress UspA family protein